MSTLPLKLPVKETICAAFLKPWAIRKPLLKALVWPLITGFLLSMVNVILFTSFTDSFKSHYWSFTIFIWFIELLRGLVFVIIAITCHRMILLSIDSVPSFGLRRWSKRETTFLLWLIGIYIMAWLFSAPLFMLVTTLLKSGDGYLHGYFAVGMSMVALIPYGIILSRLSPIFPHVALGYKASQRWSWFLTKGNGIRIFFIIIVFPFILWLPLMATYYLLGSAFYKYCVEAGFTDIYLVVSTAFQYLFYYLTIIFVISSLSMSYQWLVDHITVQDSVIR